MFPRASLIVFLLGLAALTPLPAHAQTTTDPGLFYGFWKMQEPAGDECVVNVKRGGRASCFFIGSGSSEVTKGEWEIDGERLVITWETGYRDAFTRWGQGTLERKAYQPDQSLATAPAYTTRAVRLDPRTPGSLTVDSSSSDRTPSPPSFSNSTEPAASTPSAPMRNPFIGYWAVEQSPGLFFGLIGDGSERFYLFLDRNGQASVALREWGGDNTLRGRWEVSGGRAEITWPSGRKDALTKDDNGTFRLLTYGRKDSFADRPDERREARRCEPSEASQYFNSGDVRLLTMTDIRGIWVPRDPAIEDQRRIHILGWGNAQLESSTGTIITRGNWKLYNDHVVVSWNDGATDVMRSNLMFWIVDRFAVGEAITGTPTNSFRIDRLSGE